MRSVFREYEEALDVVGDWKKESIFQAQTEEFMRNDEEAARLFMEAADALKVAEKAITAILAHMERTEYPDDSNNWCYAYDDKRRSA